MKGAFWIPPAIAAAVVVGWIGTRKQAVAAVEEEILILREKIEEAELEAKDETERKSEPGRHANGDVDWLQVVDWMRASQSESSEMRARMRLQKLVLGMSNDELSAAIDEVATMDLGRRVRAKLESMLIDQLMMRDPALALRSYIDRIEDPQRVWSFSRGFGRWLDSDPLAAMAWFDEEIGKGTFQSRSLDGRGEQRMRFESELLRSLMSSDMAGASARLAGMSEELRIEVLAGRAKSSKEGQLSALATLTREQLPADKSVEVLARHANSLMYPGGKEKVAAFFSEIEATPEEREHIVEHVGVRLMLADRDFNDEFSQESIDEFRGWVQEEAPGSLDQVTGQLVGSTWRDAPLEDRVTLLKEYHAAGGGDEMISAFLEANGGNRDPAVVRDLAAMMEDEGARTALLESIGEQEAVFEEPEK